MGTESFYDCFRWQLRSCNRPTLIQILRSSFLPVTGRKSELVQRILQHVETIIRNQDERAYSAFLLRSPIDWVGCEYEKLVYELLQKCPCLTSNPCAVHAPKASSVGQAPTHGKSNDEPLFSQPVSPEEQVLKALALIKQYQHSPELLDQFHRSILYWQSKIPAESVAKENSNQPNTAANTKSNNISPTTNPNSQGNSPNVTMNGLNPSNGGLKHNLQNSCPQPSEATPSKIQKSVDFTVVRNTENTNSQQPSNSSCFIYPRHSNLVPLTAPIRQECFKDSTQYSVQLSNPSLIPQVSLAHKIFIYRQAEVGSPASVSFSNPPFLTCNGWSFHVANTMIRVTSVLDTPIDITQYLKETHDARIVCRFIPSKEAAARVNGKEQPFFFQIVAAVEDFQSWLNTLIPKSVFTYDAVYRSLLFSFIPSRHQSSRDGDDELCVESREVSLRCPLTLCKLRNPARGINCNHFQCFELESFLDIYLTRSTRPCPICSTDIPLHQLAVDRFVLELIQQVAPDCLSLVFDKSGKWTTVQSRQNAFVVENYECTNCDVIDLTWINFLACVAFLSSHLSTCLLSKPFEGELQFQECPVQHWHWLPMHFLKRELEPLFKGALKW